MPDRNFRAGHWCALLLLIFSITSVWAGETTDCVIFADSFETNGPGPSGQNTTLAGRLLDTNDFVLGVETPIVGATVSLLNTVSTTTSDAQGFFFLANIADEVAVIDMDPSTAQPGPGGVSYAGFRERIDIKPCAANVVERPFFLPRIDASSLTEVDPNATTVVNNANIGVSITVPPHTAMMGDTEFTGQLSISEVPEGLAPAAMPGELQPGLLVTIQPVGVVFTTPVPITLPNTDSLVPDGVLDIWSLDPEAGQFVVVGRGEVSPDGTQVETTVGGVRAADWHFASPLAAEFLNWENWAGIAAPFLEQEINGGSRVAVRDGSLRVGHELPSIKSLNEDAALRFNYDSRTAYPRPVIKNVIRLPRSSFVPTVPDQISAVLRVDFLLTGPEVFTNTIPLIGSGDEELVQSLQFDASGLFTGVHVYDFTVRSYFDDSSVAAGVVGSVLINNQSESTFGAGWLLQGLDRLYLQGDDAVQLVQGDGEIIPFERALEFDFFENEEFNIDCCVSSLVAADFNNDGYPDLIDIGGSDDGVVRLNDHNGSFIVSDELGLGSTSAHTVAIGLINGDLNLDLAVSRGGSNITSKVTVLVGDGAGTFTATGDFPVGKLPVDLDLGDFDGNGTLDVVTANESAGTVSMLLGNGSGGFSAAVHFNARAAAPGGPTSIAVGDLDEDGKLDVAVASPNAEIAVLYGDGAGSLGAPVSYNINGDSQAILIEDFNNDGKLDIAATASVGSKGSVAVYLGNGLGAFSAPISTPVGTMPLSMEAADLNRDGKLDLAVANTESDNVSILLGRGNGSFLPDKTLTYPDLNRLAKDIVAIADFDLDLYPDLAVLDTGPPLADDIYIVDNLSVDSDAFVPPPHVFSKLFEEEDGSFRHLLTSGLTVRFNTQGFQTARVDLFGNEITYAYDGANRLDSVTYPVGQVFDFQYSANSITITDPTSRQTQLILDGSGDLVQISSPDGGQTHYSYGAHHDLETLTTPGGHSYTYQYDAHGMIEQSNLPNGEVRLYQPGLKKGLAESAGEGTQGNPLPIQENGDVEDIFTDGLGNETKYTTGRLGVMASKRDALNREVVFERNERQLVTSIRLASLDKLEFTYDDRGNVLSSTDALNATTLYRYNERNQLTSSSNPIGDQIVLTYDEQGALTDYDDGVISITNTYSPFGSLATSTDGAGNTSLYEYDSNGNRESATDAGGHGTEFTRDTAGNITSALNDVGQQATFTYDSMNRMLGLTNELAETTTFTYDMQGNLVTVNGPLGLLFTFTYNEVRKVTSQADALGRLTQYGFDVLRNLTSVTNPNGTSISYDYDAINRLTGITASTGEQSSFEYSKLGKHSRIEDNDSLIEATHDNMGRTKSITYNAGGVHSTQPPNVGYSLTYNEAGQVTGITQVDGTPLTYSYDGRGVLSGITTPNIDHQLTVDNSGRPTTLATQITGGVASGFVRSYTPNDQLDGLDIDVNGSTVFQYLITLDDLGNRTGITDNAGVRSYSYDAAGQLLTASHPDQSVESYTYDDLGNRLTSAFTTGTIDYDNANQIEQDSLFNYDFDANGNVITKTNLVNGETTVYSYSAFDQIVAIDHQDDMGGTISLVTYAYDAMGRRISKSVDGTVTKYAHQNDRVVASYDGTNTLLATYLHGPEPNMVLSMGTLGEQFVFHRDTIGSVIAISDEFGSILNEYHYDSFGRLMSQSETIDNPFGFTGAERDTESSLYYMRARYYDSFSGRFVQADGKGFTSGTNLYHYVKNNPLLLTDPDGEFIWGAVSGAAINRLEQAAEGRSSAKDTKPLDFGSFAFDTAMGATTCGLGGAMKNAALPAAIKTFRILPKNVVLIGKYQPALSSGKTFAVDVMTNFTGAAVSSEFKPAVTGGKPPTDDEFVRDVTLGTFSGIASDKFIKPFAPKSAGVIGSTIVDKGSGWAIGKAAKQIWTDNLPD